MFFNSIGILSKETDCDEQAVPLLGQHFDNEEDEAGDNDAGEDEIEEKGEGSSNLLIPDVWWSWGEDMLNFCKVFRTKL